MPVKEPLASTIGFLVAPLVAGVWFALGSPGLGGGINASLSSIAGLSLLGYMYALPLAGMSGLPLFLLVRRFWAITLISSICGGVAVGLVVAALLIPNSTSDLHRLTVLFQALSFPVGAGALSGATFWLVRTLCLRSNPSFKRTRLRRSA